MFNKQSIKDDIKDMMICIMDNAADTEGLPQHLDRSCDRRFTATVDGWRVSCAFNRDAINELLNKLHKAQSGKPFKTTHPTKHLKAFTKTNKTGMLAAQKRVIVDHQKRE